MNQKNTFLLICIITLVYSCKVSNGLTGRYTNEFGDKVIVKKNMTYKLEERIDNETRITKGRWQEWTRDGVQKIQFINTPRYKIDNNYTLTIENSSNKYSTVRIFYKDTDSIIEIPYAVGFVKKDTVGLLGLHSGYLKTLDFEDTLDSVYLMMWKYKDVTIKTPDSLNHIYTLRFYPTQTISYFDRVYNVSDNNFNPSDSSNKNKRLRFKKNGV